MSGRKRGGAAQVEDDSDLKSQISLQSFASAQNYNEKHHDTAGINKYIKKHPLTYTLKTSSWNNIPLPTKEMFELLVDALIGQDIHTWERKSLILACIRRVKPKN